MGRLTMGLVKPCVYLEHFEEGNEGAGYDFKLLDK